jgi:hypothetical protein
MYRGTTAYRAGVAVQIVWKNGLIGLVRGVFASILESALALWIAREER